METLEVKKRDILGKKVETLRSKGLLPAVIYGRGKETGSVTIAEKDFMKVWKTAGESSVIHLDVEGVKKGVLIHDVAMDPIKDKPLHVDFYEVDMARKVEVEVPLIFVGESEAVKMGGILVKVMHEIKVEALPGDLPHSIEVDISFLKQMEDFIPVSSIKVSKGVELKASPDDTVILVEAPRTEEEIAAETAESDKTVADIEVVGEKEKEEAKAAAAEAEKPEGKEKK